MVGLVRISLRLLADILQLAVSMPRPARGSGNGELGLPPSARALPGAGHQAAPGGSRDPSEPSVSHKIHRLARRSDRSAPRNNSSLAPGGISVVLALEVTDGSPADPDRAAPADPAHGD